MDHPVKDIKAILKKLLQGTPQQQRDAFTAYYLPNASYNCPVARVPGFKDLKASVLPDRWVEIDKHQDNNDQDNDNTALAGLFSSMLGRLPVVHSRRLIQSLYRLTKVAFPTTDLNIESAVYDQRAGILTAHITETIAPTLMPFYHPRVHTTVVLRLVQRTIDAQGRMLMPAIEGTQSAQQGAKTRLVVASQEDLIQPGDVIKIFIPFVGAIGYTALQLIMTAMLLSLALVILPVVSMVPEKVVSNGENTAETTEKELDQVPDSST